MSKRFAVLYIVLIFLSLLALVAGSVSAAPSQIKNEGNWSRVCSVPGALNVFVLSKNVVQFDCKGTSGYDWSEVCAHKKAAVGYTSDNGSGISVTCGI